MNLTFKIIGCIFYTGFEIPFFGNAVSPWNDTKSPDCLANLRVGVDAAVYGVDKGEDERLQEMGLVEGTPVQVISAGESMVVKIGDQSLCLPKDRANHIAVVPV